MNMDNTRIFPDGSPGTLPTTFREISGAFKVFFFFSHMSASQIFLVCRPSSFFHRTKSNLSLNK
jgi:hypothetical protein